MDWFRKLKLATQLITAFLVVACITVVIGLVGVSQTRKVGALVKDMHDNQLIPVQELHDVNAYLTHHYHRALYAALAGNAQDREKYLGDFGKYKELFWKSYNLEMACSPAPGEKDVWAQVPALWAGYEESVNRMVALYRDNKAAEAEKYAFTVVRDRYNPLLELVNKDIELNVKDSANSFAASEATMDKAQTQAWIGIGAGFLVAIALGLAVTGIIKKQVGGEPSYAAEVAQRVAAGDLTVAVSVDAGATGSMMAAMKAMVASLSAVLAETQNVVEAASRGEFHQRIQVAGAQGYILELGTSLNQLTTMCQRGLSDVVRVLEAAARGDLTERIDAAYEGEFGRL